MSKKNHTVRKLALGAAAAGVAGYVAGVLSAPRKGDKTRKLLKNQASKELDSAENKLSFLYSELDELIATAKGEAKGLDPKNKQRFDRALDHAQGSKQKLEKVIDAVKTGSSEDKDLGKAIKEAEKAIVHAKNFLLKK